MRLRNVFATGSMVTALLLAPGMLSAKMQNPCPMTQTTAESNSSCSSQRALNLMSAIRTKSEGVVNQADELLFTRPLAIDSPVYQAGRLTVIKNEINAMGQDLSRLRAIRQTLPAWEQAAVDRAAQKLQMMAVHTTDAITYLNTEHTGLWRPEYQKFESTLRSEARDLHRLMEDCVSYSQARTQANSLAKHLDVKTTS